MHSPVGIGRAAAVAVQLSRRHEPMPASLRQQEADASQESRQGHWDGSEGTEGPLFSCRIDNAKVLTATLTCLLDGTKKDQLAQVEISDTGLVFIVTGRAKFTQSQGTIRSELFDTYECAAEGGRFTISLPLLLECLQIFGPQSVANTSLTMSYETAQAVLKLTLEEQGVLTTCEINTIEDGEDSFELAALATAFRRTNEVFRAILKSEQLKEAIADLADMPGASTVGVRVSPDAPHFHLSVDGNYGRLDIRFPDKSEAFVHFECAEEHEFSYQLAALNQGMRALSVAKETFVRINEEGIMCVQHQVENFNGQTTYIDFLMCAMEEEGNYEGDASQPDDGQEAA